VKGDLMKNIQILCKKHPSYNSLVGSYRAKSTKSVREFRVLIFFNVSKNILFIDHELGGGTSVYRDEKIERYLRDGERVILFSYNFLLNRYKISFYLSEDSVFCYEACGFEDIEKVNRFMRVDEIFLNSIVSFKNSYELHITAL
jgi:hypothetical protein